MAVTPDKLDQIIELLLDIKGSLEAGAGQPPAPPAADEADKFLAKWAPVMETEFKAKYSVPLSQPIPSMVVYDEAEAIYRARCGYSTQGLPTRGFTRLATVAFPAIDVIAHATQATAPNLYETGYGLTDPDVCAYGFCVGLFATQQEYAASLGAAKQPRAYAGVTLQHMLAPNFSGGGPSV